jgi:undecaprenyl-diphosphatase
MTFFEAIILGAVQGITEFLPISSTAHVVIAQYLLGTQFPGLFIEIFLHLASVLAVMLYFRKDLLGVIQDSFLYLPTKNPRHKTGFFFGVYILIGTFITGFFGILLTQQMGSSIKSPLVVSLALVVTGVFLFLIERVVKYGNRKTDQMTFIDAIVVGTVQTIAVLPGISRSGSTLVAALWLKLDRETSVRFSFLLAIPVILGSGVLGLRDFQSHDFSALGILPMGVSFFMSFSFSLLGIIFLIRVLERAKLSYFSIYCFSVAAFVYFVFDPNVVIGV